MPPKVVAVAAGEAHTLALTGDGQVYSWGRGPFGRLGTGREDDELVPTAVAPAVSASGTPRPRFVAVAAGAYHSLALDDEGSLWSWGYNLYGQLGYGDQNSLFPCLVEQFQDLGSPETLNDEDQDTRDRTCLKLSSVKAGGMMSFAIDSLGGLWIWGSCPQQTDAGEFCIASSSIPLPVWDFHGHTVVKVACGNEHVVAAVSVGETYTC